MSTFLKDYYTFLCVKTGEGERRHLNFITGMVQAAAYYYHGLILDEGNTEKSRRMAVAALQSAEELLKESKDVAEAFHAAPPVSRQRQSVHPSLYFFFLTWLSGDCN